MSFGASPLTQTIVPGDKQHQLMEVWGLGSGDYPVLNNLILCRGFIAKHCLFFPGTPLRSLKNPTFRGLREEVHTVIGYLCEVFLLRRLFIQQGLVGLLRWITNCTLFVENDVSGLLPGITIRTASPLPSLLCAQKLVSNAHKSFCSPFETVLRSQLGGAATRGCRNSRVSQLEGAAT